ncbi:MAG: hypothetical protein ACFFD1_00975 [Candidatus Thorarchaeota archaeon]
MKCPKCNTENGITHYYGKKCKKCGFTLVPEGSEISFCNSCYCMTKSKPGYIYICGKCGKDRRKNIH